MALPCVTMGHCLLLRIHCDYSGENLLVGILMNLLCGSLRITTELNVCGEMSTERSLNLHAYNFMTWKILANSSQMTMYIALLCTVFLPICNHKLASFAAAWNMHHIQTAHNKTTNQLWVESIQLLEPKFLKRLPLPCGTTTKVNDPHVVACGDQRLMSHALHCFCHLKNFFTRCLKPKTLY